MALQRRLPHSIEGNKGNNGNKVFTLGLQPQRRMRSNITRLALLQGLLMVSSYSRLKYSNNSHGIEELRMQLMSILSQ